MGNSLETSKVTSGSSSNPNIQENISFVKEDKKLYYRFLFFESHALMIFYTTFPTNDDDKVLKVELVYDGKDSHRPKKNIVVFKVRTWSDFRDYRISNEEYPLKISILDVLEFCKDYQKKYPRYDTLTNNCRRFMKELCKKMGTKFPDLWKCEDLWYGYWKIAEKVKGKNI